MKFKFFRFSFFAVFLCFIVSCSTEDVPATETVSDTPKIVLDYDYTPIELETMTLINNYRVSIGLKPLEKINHVSFKSEEHDEYMIAKNDVSHDNFEARLANIIKVLGAKKVSENVAYNYNSAQGVFDAWLKSESHKENIEGDFTHFGLSIRESPTTGKKYFTNIFVKI
nr:CAP domain-containing protein [uncultured Flavobacterium sp.]